MAFGLDSIKATPSVTYDLIPLLFLKTQAQFWSRGVFTVLSRRFESLILLWCKK